MQLGGKGRDQMCKFSLLHVLDILTHDDAVDLCLTFKVKLMPQAVHSVLNGEEKQSNGDGGDGGDGGDVKPREPPLDAKPQRVSAIGSDGAMVLATSHLNLDRWIQSSSMPLAWRSPCETLWREVNRLSYSLQPASQGCGRCAHQHWEFWFFAISTLPLVQAFCEMIWQLLDGFEPSFCFCFLSWGFFCAFSRVTWLALFATWIMGQAGWWAKLRCIWTSLCCTSSSRLGLIDLFFASTSALNRNND